MVFNDIAATYDAARPGYPAPAVGDLVARCHLDRTSEILEIGCGTGQLTRDLAALGCPIRALEPGPSLATLAGERLSAFRNVTIVRATFEDEAEVEKSFDAIVAGTSFHWVDPGVGYAKAAVLLRRRGCLALLSNLQTAGGNQAHIADPIRELHRRLAPQIGDWMFPTVDDVLARAGQSGDLATRYGRIERRFADPPDIGQWFAEPTVSTFAWTAAYDADRYVAMMSTLSPYALLDVSNREELFATIKELIDDQLDGQITKEYVTVLLIAERLP